MLSMEVNDSFIYSFTGFPESVRNLYRYRGRIKGDMAAIDRRLWASIADCKRQFGGKSNKAYITELEDRMIRLLALHSKKQRKGTGKDITSMCNQFHKEWYGWVRAAKQHSKKNSANTGWIRQGDLVDRMSFPSFNGSQEGWAEFKRVFQEMISPNGLKEYQSLRKHGSG